MTPLAPWLGSSNDVNILAADQWKATLSSWDGDAGGPVQPNASVISALMPDVSDRLAAATGRSAVDGYQTENPERVDAIAQAMYDACARGTSDTPNLRKLGTCRPKSPHASRSPRGQAGNLLDTAVTMAAALEQAGSTPRSGCSKGMSCWAIGVSIRHWRRSPRPR